MRAALFRHLVTLDYAEQCLVVSTFTAWRPCKRLSDIFLERFLGSGPTVLSRISSTFFMTSKLWRTYSQPSWLSLLRADWLRRDYKI
jgi:hypothetical protein